MAERSVGNQGRALRCCQCPPSWHSWHASVSRVGGTTQDTCPAWSCQEEVSGRACYSPQARRATSRGCVHCLTPTVQTKGQPRGEASSELLQRPGTSPRGRTSPRCMTPRKSRELSGHFQGHTGNAGPGRGTGSGPQAPLPPRVAGKERHVFLPRFLALPALLRSAEYTRPLNEPLPCESRGQRASLCVAIRLQCPNTIGYETS